MRTKQTILKIVLLSMFLPFAVACGKEKKKNDEGSVVDFTTSRKTDYGDDWIYFSFSQGAEVEVAEANHKTDLSWDIAFNRYNIRTNSGESGNGQGGAYDAGKVDFDNFILAPDNGYVVDTVYEISDVGSGFPPPMKESSANLVLCEAIQFSGPPPAYTPSEHVYVVKTADGKYVKVFFKSFYDSKGVSGFVSFKYFYQSDGSKKLQ